MTETRTIFLVRSPDLVWMGARLILESFPDVTIAGEVVGVAQGAVAVAAVTPPPDLIITAPRGPGLSVHELLPELRRACPSATILILAESIGPDDLTAVAAGGIERYAGYLLWKDLSRDTLRQCLGAISGGDIITISRAAAERFLDGARHHTVVRPAADVSPRERELLRQLAAGRTLPEVAVSMGLGKRTVNRTVAQLCRRLEASSQFVLGMKAAQLGLVPATHANSGEAQDRNRGRSKPGHDDHVAAHGEGELVGRNRPRSRRVGSRCVE